MSKAADATISINVPTARVARSSSGLGKATLGELVASEIERKPDSEEITPNKQAVSSLAMALLAFSCVAGGPFGIEVAVGAAGAFATLLGLVAAGVFWGLPTALITAELAAALPSNGGPVVWVRRGLGKRWAFVNGILLVVQQATDIVLYPTLLASYIAQMAPNLNNSGVYAIKCAALAITALLNIFGVEALSASATVLTAIIMLPFVLLPMVAAGKHMSFDWAAVGPAGTPPGVEAQLALFCSTVLWNMQGWSELGALAGEVKNAEVVFPRGMSIAAVLVILAYSCPVVFGVALSPNLANWDDGFLADLAQDVAPWLSILVLISAALANLSTFLTSMAAYSRTMQAMAREGFLPIPFLARNMTKWHTPVPCILVLTATTAGLMYNLDFSQLVIIDSTFFMVAQISAILSWIRLRHTEPDLRRPYLFPGGPYTAHAVAVITVAIAIFAMYAVASGTAWWAAAVTAGIIVLLFVISLFMERCGLGNRLPGYDDEGAEEDEDGEGGDGEGTPLIWGSKRLSDGEMHMRLLDATVSTGADGKPPRPKLLPQMSQGTLRNVFEARAFRHSGSDKDGRGASGSGSGASGSNTGRRGSAEGSMAPAPTATGGYQVGVSSLVPTRSGSGSGSGSGSVGGPPTGMATGMTRVSSYGSMQ